MIDDSDFKIKAQSFSRKVEKLIVICTKNNLDIQWYLSVDPMKPTLKITEEENE